MYHPPRSSISICITPPHLSNIYTSCFVSQGCCGLSLLTTSSCLRHPPSPYSRVLLSLTPLSPRQVVGYLKLAHLVPFSMLLDVTNMSPDAVLQALSVEGRQKGLLMRGNWAALAADVWPRGPPHAADCLSVAQCLLHRWAWQAF